jgi:three-Cys-motif partner protein
MSRPSKLRFDEIGYWSEVKLDIIKQYAKQYSTILTAQEQPRLYHVYIDAFAGARLHVSKTSGEVVAGSPLNALNTNPPFREYHFIDFDGQKVENLSRLASGRPNVYVYEGDCNRIMLEQVLLNVRYEHYRRGLCLLDPYGLHLNWEVTYRAGQLGTIDLFLNFPIMDMNRNVLWRETERVSQDKVARMTAYWGDESWREVAYESQPGLFDDFEEKVTNRAVAEAFRMRLKKVAGFENVPEPVPMRNSCGAVVYYLFFASQKPVADDIVTHIFNKYRRRGSVSG